MFTSIYNSTDRSNSTQRFEYNKNETMNLLQKVKQHIEKKNTKFSKQNTIDSKQLDEQVNIELGTVQDDDNQHQQYIDKCVREIMNQQTSTQLMGNEIQQKPLKTRQSLSIGSLNLPKNRMKRLNSTILVEQMVKNKGLTKPTLSQIKQQQIDKLLNNRKNTEITSNRPTRLILPLIISKEKNKSQNKRIISQEASPQFEHNSTMLSDSFEQSPKYESNRRIETLIQQINSEKDEITTQQRRIRHSIVLNQKNFMHIDRKCSPEKGEQYNYLQKEKQKIYIKLKKSIC